MILSTPLPAEAANLASGRHAIVMALDTLVDQKSLIVGLTVGAMQGPDLAKVRVSPIGQAIIDRCARHQQLNYPHAPAVVAGVAQVSSAVQRVRHVLANAPPGAFVLLLCSDNKVYDAAYPALGIDFKAANGRAQ